MTPRVPVVLSTADLPLAELGGAALDGDLFPLGDGWCPLDEPVGSVTRALAIAGSLPRRVIVERMTAAWIYGAAPEPARYQLCVDRGKRANVPLSARYTVREVTGVAGDTASVGGLRVTTPVRTLLDLCRDSSLAPGDVVPVIRHLLELGLVGAADAARRLAGTDQPGTARSRSAARTRFAAAVRCDASTPADPRLTTSD
jgi:AbiEi antitoxin C-terminal domain